MKIHTDRLGTMDVLIAAREVGVDYDVSVARSATHVRRLDVHLYGSCPHRSMHNPDRRGATWDQWGAFLAALYERDPEFRVGDRSCPVYRDAEDFHATTGYRFAIAHN